MWNKNDGRTINWTTMTCMFSLLCLHFHEFFFCSFVFSSVTLKMKSIFHPLLLLLFDIVVRWSLLFIPYFENTQREREENVLHAGECSSQNHVEINEKKIKSTLRGYETYSVCLLCPVACCFSKRFPSFHCCCRIWYLQCTSYSVDFNHMAKMIAWSALQFIFIRFMGYVYPLTKS